MNEEEARRFVAALESQLNEVQALAAFQRAFDATFRASPEAARDALRDLARIFLRYPERGRQPRPEEPVGEGGRTKADEEIERERNKTIGSPDAPTPQEPKCPHCGTPLSVTLREVG